MTSEGRSSGQVVLLGHEAVLRYVVTVMLVSVLLFAAYAVVVCLLCNAAWPWLSAVTLVALQLLLGICLVKKYHGLGTAARSRWRFQDPSALGPRWHSEQESVSSGDIQTIFDRWYAIVAKHDTERLDDYTDVGWFVVILQAAVTGALLLFGNWTAPVCLVSVLTLASVSTAMFVDGYRNNQGMYMEEDLGHLEYLVRARLTAFDAGAGECPVRDVILWSRLGIFRAVRDLGKIIEGELRLGSHLVLTYWVGMSAAGPQRFEIRTSVAANTVVPLLSATPFLSLRDWSVKEADGVVLVTEPSNSISLGERTSFVVSPAERDAQFSLVKRALVELSDRLGLVCPQHNLNEPSSMLP